MQRIILSNIKSKKLFCETYWENIQKNIKNKPYSSNSDFHFFNKHITCIPKPTGFFFKPTVPVNFIEEGIKNDLTLRLRTSPIKDELILYRGIPNPANTEQTSKYTETLFQRAINLKPKDILYMPEYSFWATEKSYVQHYMGRTARESFGILYEVVCRKGSYVFNDPGDWVHILKRASKFLCLSNKKIIDDKRAYHLIELELLPRNIAEDANLLT